MGLNPNGRPGRGQAQEWLNVFALVIYIPDPLGRFLDDLRRELVPEYDPHAHVSVLPPRPLAVEWQVAAEETRALLERWVPFDVELCGLKSFPVTEVLYLELGAGARELRRMHAEVRGGSLEFEEPFPYHPHITLAQGISHEQVAATYELAHRRWEEYRGERFFRAERAVFVQNTISDVWVDLAEFPLGAAALK